MKGLVIAAMLCALAASGMTPPAAWEPREFPVSFWCGPPDPFITTERYRQIADAGFTLVMPPCEGAATRERNRRILDTAKATGLKVFVADDRMPLAISGVADARQRLDAIVADYAKHPALAGYYVVDEPGASAFAGLADVAAYLREKDPAHPAYINLLPNYATEAQLGTPTYEQYVQDYVRAVKPFAISYDHYHFLKDGDRPGFFANLAVVRRIALDSALPFWQIVLSVPHGPYRPLTEAEKRWEAMQTLAYGGKGLMYFTYWTPGDTSFDWSPALIAHDGAPTRQYDEVKRINADVRAIGKYLLNAVPVTVFQNGDLSPGGTPREQGTPITFAGGGDVTTGLFRADTHLYVLFANRNYRSATKADVQLQVANHKVQKLDRATGHWREVTGESTVDGDLKLHLDLPPADAELYRW